MGFYRRHPELKACRLKAIEWSGHDHSIQGKITEWFNVIGKEPRDQTNLTENAYRMDETGVLLSAPASLKVLVSKDDPKKYRGAAMPIECISADGRSLPPLTVWPAAAHGSS